jgi:hypothetical protein
MYLAKQLTPRSLPEIGGRFGGRDHTTIMHGVRKIEELMATDSQLADDLQLLRRCCRAESGGGLDGGKAFRTVPKRLVNRRKTG